MQISNEHLSRDKNSDAQLETLLKSSMGGISFVASPRTVTLSRFGATAYESTCDLEVFDINTSEKWCDVRYVMRAKHGDFGYGTSFQVPEVDGYDTAVLMLWKQSRQVWNVRVQGAIVGSFDNMMNLRMPNCNIRVEVLGSYDGYVAEYVCVRYMDKLSMHAQCRVIHDSIPGRVVITSLPEPMVNQTHEIGLIGNQTFDGGPRLGLDRGGNDWGEEADFDVNIPVSHSSRWVGIVVDAESVESLSTRDMNMEYSDGLCSYIIPCPNSHVAVVMSSRGSTTAVVQVVEARGTGVVTTAYEYGFEYFFGGDAVPSASTIAFAGCGPSGHSCLAIEKHRRRSSELAHSGELSRRGSDESDVHRVGGVSLN
jgi:hypothetical protein